MAERLGRAVLELATEGINTVVSDLNKIEAHTKQVASTSTSLVSGLKTLGGALGVAFSGAAVLGFAKNLLDTADATVKLADKTGMSIEAVQRLGFVAEQSGNTLDQVSSAVSQLQRRIAGGDESATGALAQLGISMQAFTAMSPDQQFMGIAREVAKIEDPMQRAKVATELFGRAGTELLPTLIADVDKLGASFVGMSDQATRSLDQVGDALSHVASVGITVAGETLAVLVDGLRVLGSVAKSVATFDIKPLLETLTDVSDLALPKLPPALQLAIPSAKGVALSFDEMDKVSKELTKSVEAKAKAIDKAAEADKKAKEKAKEFADVVDYFGTRVDHATFNALVPYAESLSDAATKADILEATQPPLASSTDVATKAIEEAWRATGKYVQMTGTAAQTTGLFTGVLDGLGDTIVKAFQGGGNVLASIGGTIGKQLGDNVVRDFGGTISKHLPKFLGDAINSIIPGVGALLGPLLGKIGGFFKGLFGGIPAEVKAARTEVDAFQATLAKTLTTTQQAEAGGEKWKMTVIAVRDAYLATGRTAAEAEAIVKQLWDTDNPDRARNAIEEINRVLKEQGDVIGDNDAALADLHAEMRQLTDDSQVDWQDLRDTAQKYGIDLAALGPSFQSARLREKAQEIWNDFRKLELKNVDVGATIVGMKDEIVALALESMQFGVQIPANFKPLIDNLLQSNQLTEDERAALERLGDENFGDPIVSKLDAIATRLGELVTKIGELSDRLGRNVPIAAQAAATGVANAFSGLRIDIPVNFNISEMPDITPMAEGGSGRVSRPTLFLAGEAGPEEFAFSGANRTFGRDETPVEVHSHLHLDGRVVARAVQRHWSSTLALQGVAT